MSWNRENWPEKPCNCFEDLQKHITTMLRKAETPKMSLAWRGLGRAEWTLRSTLDRLFEDVARDTYYSACVGGERGVLEEFRHRALQFSSQIERIYLEHSLDGPGIWNVMAIGRHSGLPTRILDWTWSPYVAAYFACIGNGDADGAICWFNQSQLDEILDSHWDELGVPTRAEVLGLTHIDDRVIKQLGLNQRALEETAFNDDGPTWITKLHYNPPFPRMEAQQGFMTVCSRIRKDHNDAIDDLARKGTIDRGRIIIPAGIRCEVLKRLRLCNVNAQSLKYPGIDIVADTLKAKHAPGATGGLSASARIDEGRART